MGDFIRQHRKAGTLAALLFIIVLLIAAKYNFRTKSDIPPTPVNEAPVQAEIINKPTGIVRAGTVESPYVVPINSGFSGRVSDLYVIEGQTVKAGQALFKLEPSAVSEIASAGKTGVPPSGQDNYENALKDYTRYQKLYEQGAIPRRQLENAAARLQAAQANGGQDARAQNGTVTLTAPMVVVAPVDGTVADLAAAAGSTLQAGQQVMTLGGGQKVEVVVQLEQKELYLVHLGTPAAIEVDGNAIKGQVASIFPLVQENTIPGFLAYIKLTNLPDGLLKPGMSVTIRIDTGI
ncbi:MAG: efflux RND transporter periplasmic adaptor subunit [Negativicutes bacterium]|nr:efflux RND transporter periplasmic adaptor subunit [Negativicutes bacterium]